MTTSFPRALLLAALVVAVWLVLPSAALAADAKAFPHDDWAGVLSKFVDARGFVDYESLAKDRAALDRYVAAVAKHSPDSSPELFPTRDDELAYWINAYNARVFEGVLQEGPEIDSVWSIGLISGRVFFTRKKFSLGGVNMSLKKLEDHIVRARYEDPRIHAALNCASVSCPRLPQTPFIGAQLDQQLDAAIREFVAESRNCTVDTAAQEVSLSKIFDWFGRDFVGYEKRQGNPRGTVVDYVNRYRAKGQEIPSDYDVEFFAYDKALNRQ